LLGRDQHGLAWGFTDSLKHPNQDKQYRLAVNHQGEIVGVTGLYYDFIDKNIAWLGWFGVHPQHRRHDLGSMLLEFAMSEAEKRGFSVLKLYSSFDKNERAAHSLYMRYGFIHVTSDKNADKIIFQKELR
jgi:GNAT superfamily N-acetyltransferase